MWWIPYLPPAISCYFIFLSGSMSRYLRRDIDRFVVHDETLRDKKVVIQNVALSWEAKVGFINAMLAAMVTPFVTYVGSGNYTALTITFVVLFLLFSAMLWKIFSYDSDGLAAVTEHWRFWKRQVELTPARKCQIVLIFVNVILMIATAVEQYLTVG